MIKELEALDDLFDLVTCQGSFEKAQKFYYIIEQALQRLEQIDNAEPSEVLECLETLLDKFGQQILIAEKLPRNATEITNVLEYLNKTPQVVSIKQALIKAQEQEKVLSIIYEKNVDIFELKCCSSAKEYNDSIRFKVGFIKNYELTQEEFDLLKRWAECQKN